MRKPFHLAMTLLLCVLSGSGWLLLQFWPSALPYPFSACIHFALIACVAWPIVLRRRTSLPKYDVAVPVAIAGVCLFALPNILLDFAGGSVSERTSAILFCAIPLVTVVGATAMSASGSARALLVPSLVGLAGAMLLFSFTIPASLGRWLSLALVAGCCVIVAIAGLQLHRLLAPVALPGAVALIATASAAVLGLYSVRLGWPPVAAHLLAAECLRCCIFDLPVVWLAVWLMREVNPVRLSTRFLLAPMVTVLEGYGLIGHAPDFRSIAALLLLLTGGLLLLLKSEADEPGQAPGLSLR